MEKIFRFAFVILGFATLGYGIYVSLEKNENVVVSEQNTTLRNENLELKHTSLELKLKDVNLEALKTGAKKTFYDVESAKIKVGDAEYDFFDLVIRLRGNSTFLRDKKPYQIQFAEKTELFGLAKAKTWVLLANDIDFTMMRNYFAGEVARVIGFDVVPEGEYVEVYFDGEYEGLYYLTPKVTAARVGLRDETAVLGEIDNVHFDPGSGRNYMTTTLGNLLTISDYLTSDDKVDGVAEQFFQKFDEAERLAKAGDFGEAYELIDMESFAKYYLLSLVSMEQDAFGSSEYFYQWNSNGKIFAGPPWDYDLSFGRAFGREEVLAEETKIGAGGQSIYDYLVKDEAFLGEMKRIFRENLEPQVESLTSGLENKYSNIKEMIERDHEKWHADDEKNLDEQYEALKKWFLEHMKCVGEELGE